MKENRKTFVLKSIGQNYYILEKKILARHTWVLLKLFYTCMLFIYDISPTMMCWGVF